MGHEKANELLRAHMEAMSSIIESLHMLGLVDHVRIGDYDPVTDGPDVAEAIRGAMGELGSYQAQVHL